MASWRWVRPILTMPSNARAFASRVARSRASAGSSRSLTSTATATWMAVGKTSLVDCERLTWSLGCTLRFAPSASPIRSAARLAITSLAFMLLWVPLPVCQTTSGKWSSRRPSMTSCAASRIASETSAGRSPSARLTTAAHCLTRASARISGRGRRSPPILKFSSERWVCAPQYRSAGTSTSPMLSRSMRVPIACRSRLDGGDVPDVVW